jgi:hypothetical protein
MNVNLSLWTEHDYVSQMCLHTRMSFLSCTIFYDSAPLYFTRQNISESLRPGDKDLYYDIKTQ